MGRILLIILAVVAALFLVGPLLGFALGLLKWGLIIGGVAVAVVLASKWFGRA
ncbi:hypothetical protein [Nonomuraea sp. SBT364]|uniref:hypothetical protein n=1 Tax=Nonomuraea sp. SBT364 TaxID=1580530 RepID=UPI0018CEE115|nr:hypothetical protein [Nonomuraea sp. SBT364]